MNEYVQRVSSQLHKLYGNEMVYLQSIQGWLK
jgi:hypothetical protein